MRRLPLALLLGCGASTPAAPTADPIPGNAVPGPSCATPPKIVGGEAGVQLTRLGKAARVFFVDVGRFPVGTAGPTPATPCGDPDGCVIASEVWLAEGSPWAELDFTVDDPSRLQYRFEGGDQAFVATATWDAGCGEPVTWTLRGSVSDTGQPTVTPVESSAP